MQTDDKIKTELLDSNDPSWSEKIDILRSRLGAPNNPRLFPPHFLKSALPKLGGHILAFKKNRKLIGAGFLFPRNSTHSKPAFTLRFHKAYNQTEIDAISITKYTQSVFPDNHIEFYDAESEHDLIKTSEPAGEFNIGRPDRKEAEQVRFLQQQIWGYNSEDDQDYLYPVDIHSQDFSLGTSLVVRNGQEIAGFLFGFFKFDSSLLPAIWQQQFRTDFRIESQLLGVAPEFRGRQFGYLLKKYQAKAASKEGIDIINWTVDPLQYRNAVLNFGQLRAVSFNYYPDYYSFRNELNQVTASRFKISWLINSRRVLQALDNQTKNEGDIFSQYPDIHVVNQGWQQLELKSDRRMIAIEIPCKWTTLQRENIEIAAKWREATDRLFSHYIGAEQDQYMITDVAEKNRRCYLIAQRINNEVLAEL